MITQLRLTIGFVIAMIILFALTLLSYRTTSQLISDIYWVDRSREALRRLDLLQTYILEAETAARGYVITEDYRYLDSFHAAAGSVEAIRNIIHQLLADYPGQLHRFNELESVVADKLVVMQEIINLRRSNSEEAAAELIQIRGSLLSKEIHRQLEEMKEEGRRLLTERLTVSQANAHKAKIMLLVGMTLSFAFLFSFFYFPNRDITGRKRAERTLRAHTDEVEDFYNHAPCGYHSLNADGTFVRINDTELRWLGYSRDEVIGRMKFTNVVTDEGIEIFEKNFPVLKEQGSVQGLEFMLVKRDGSTMPVLLSATAVKDADGNFAMSRSIVFDDADRKRAEQEKDKLINELKEALSDAKTLNGLLPICSYCKRVRDDRSCWQQVEDYITERTDAQVSHSICPVCYETEVKPELEEFKKQRET